MQNLKLCLIIKFEGCRVEQTESELAQTGFAETGMRNRLYLLRTRIPAFLNKPDPIFLKKPPRASSKTGSDRMSGLKYIVGRKQSPGICPSSSGSGGNPNTDPLLKRFPVT